MNSIQDELALERPDLAIQLLGVNKVDLDGGNQQIIDEGSRLPWLQDVDLDADGVSDAWAAWAVSYRDVVIVDGTNWPVAVFNVTDYDLGEEANFTALKQLLVNTAAEVCRSNGAGCLADAAAICP